MIIFFHLRISPDGLSSYVLSTPEARYYINRYQKCVWRSGIAKADPARFATCSRTHIHTHTHTHLGGSTNSFTSSNFLLSLLCLRIAAPDPISLLFSRDHDQFFKIQSVPGVREDSSAFVLYRTKVASHAIISDFRAAKRSADARHVTQCQKTIGRRSCSLVLCGVTFFINLRCFYIGNTPKSLNIAKLQYSKIIIVVI